ncbi:MAG: sialidase family protein [Pseudomonadota bacterium]
MTDLFETSRRALRQALAAAALLLLAGAALAQAGHEQHMKAGKGPELGMAAAVDAQDALWTVHKDSDGAGQFLLLRKSIDGGVSWSEPKRILAEPEAISAEGENRPKLAFGAKGEVYVSYTKPLAKPFTGEIRFIRSIDGGASFAPPITVHANRDVITHRFDAMIVDPQGRIFIAWIDKRDVAAERASKAYAAGAGIFYAVSDDRGASFRGDFRLVRHTCECCRIALAVNAEGKVMALWRHVFDPNIRDHAMGELKPGGETIAPARVTFDDWRIDACPHQGPALAFGADGTRYQAWSTVKRGEGGLYYASAPPGGPLELAVKLGSGQADHAAIGVDGKTVVLAWRQFDGKATAIMSKISNDAGRTWRARELAHTATASDHPQLLKGHDGMVLVWRTEGEGVRVVPIVPSKQE